MTSSATFRPKALNTSGIARAPSEIAASTSTKEHAEDPGHNARLHQSLQRGDCQHMTTIVPAPRTLSSRNAMAGACTRVSSVEQLDIFAGATRAALERIALSQFLE